MQIEDILLDPVSQVWTYTETRVNSNLIKPDNWVISIKI